jgi:hypothetical protein
MINLYTELDEISFIAGSMEYLEFEICDKNNKPVDLANMKSIMWQMAYLGDKDNPILVKNGVIFNGNCFKVVLDANDTINLRGKFIHHPVITDEVGNIYKPAEGLINIVGAIKG